MTSPINNTAFYADPQALASLKHDAKAQDPAALKEAAKQFESLFTQMLLKSMREANKSFGDSMFGGDEAEFYQGMFDDQMAVHLSQGKGLGLADMLIRQLAGGSMEDSASVDGPRSAVRGQNSLLNPPPVAGGGQGGGITTHAPLTTSKADFVRSMLPHAEQAAREIGVDPHALLAQAALETGWGKSVPCNSSGECSYNLFGIKATGQWSGATVNVPTLEFEDGIAVRKAERFRAYDSPADSFRDYASLIRNNPRYENAVGAGNDVGTFASALQQGGYATDPNYARKIVAVARELRELTANEQLKSSADAPIASYAGVRP
jgi:peptidoglycan hydrolase FlgJ